MLDADFWRAEAERLAADNVVLQAPVNRPAGHPDVAGPQVRHARDLPMHFQLATGRRRWVLPVRLPGRISVPYEGKPLHDPGQAEAVVAVEVRPANPRVITLLGTPASSSCR